MGFLEQRIKILSDGGNSYLYLNKNIKRILQAIGGFFVIRVYSTMHSTRSF
jgi:hypothetical protein